MPTATGYMAGWDAAAHYTGVSRATLHRAEKAGLLQPLRVGSRVLFTPTMLDEFVRASSGEPDDGEPDDDTSSAVAVDRVRVPTVKQRRTPADDDEPPAAS